jgi:protein-tyrosine phosphatase
MVIHCNAGLGRAPTLACCLLVAGGLHPDEAVLRVGAARGRTVPEMDSQYAFIHAFAERQAASAARRSKSKKTGSVSPKRLSS